jgi:hypothetical protein
MPKISAETKKEAARLLGELRRAKTARESKIIVEQLETVAEKALHRNGQSEQTPA